MAVPRTLLLTPTRPGESSVGEIFLRDLCRLFPTDKLVCYAPVAPDYEVGVASADLNWLPMVVRKLPPERVPVKEGRAITHGDCVRQLNFVKDEIQPLIDEAVRYAQEQQVELIWSVIAGPAMIYIAKAVAERLKLPMMSLVWDPLDYVCADRGYDEDTRREIFDEFEKALQLSQCCGAASEGMKQLIEMRYDRPCEVLIAAAHPSLRIDRGPELRNPGQLVIGFAGSMYAAREIQALMYALTSVGWEIEGRKVVFRILGNVMNLQVYTAAQQCRIEFLGFHRTADAIKELSKADLAYLPYWFDEKYVSSVRQSFPNKFATYLSSGCPVFYHGPEDSSPTRFLERYPVGVACHSLDTDSIVSTLRRFVTDEELRCEAAEARAKALEEELHPDIMRSRFARLLGSEESALLASCI